MPKLLSVKVGLPRETAWQGKVVRTALWKRPVSGRVLSRRLNLDGDGQADLKGHGGERRAVMVYQLEAYRPTGIGSANLAEMTSSRDSLERTSLHLTSANGAVLLAAEV
jgi:hypothetical protein